MVIFPTGALTETVHYLSVQGLHDCIVAVAALTAAWLVAAGFCQGKP